MQKASKSLIFLVFHAWCRIKASSCLCSFLSSFCGLGWYVLSTYALKCRDSRSGEPARWHKLYVDPVVWKRTQRRSKKSISFPVRKGIFVVLPQISHVIIYQGSRLVDSSELVFCNCPFVVKMVKHRVEEVSWCNVSGKLLSSVSNWVQLKW